MVRANKEKKLYIYIYIYLPSNRSSKMISETQTCIRSWTMSNVNKITLVLLPPSLKTAEVNALSAICVLCKIGSGVRVKKNEQFISKLVDSLPGSVFLITSMPAKVS